MAFLGNLTAGVGVQTVINIQYTPQIVHFGAGITSLPLSNFSVSVAGEEVININGNLLINAFAKWLYEMIGFDTGAVTPVAYIALGLKVADGNLPNQQTQLRFTNNAAVPVPIYEYSDAIGSNVVSVSTSSINANANDLITNFDGLFIDPSNFDNAEVTFSNGFTNRFLFDDLVNYFTQTNQSDFTGTLEGQIAVNNISNSIAAIRLYAAGTGQLDYCKAIIPG